MVISDNIIWLTRVTSFTCQDENDTNAQGEQAGPQHQPHASVEYVSKVLINFIKLNNEF